MNESIRFLTLAEVLLIYENQIRLYGGDYGIRDMNLISSAIALPESTFNQTYLHNDIFEMASAYTFHLYQNHPFIDGNKQTALAAALVFLELNGTSITAPEGLLYDTMMKMASSGYDKTRLTRLIEDLSKR